MNEEHWYFHEHLKPVGPISASQMRSKILRGEVGPNDLICCGADGDWKSAKEWGVFEVVLFPALQGHQKHNRGGEEIKEWVLLVAAEQGRVSRQEGPFTIAEVLEKIKGRESQGQHYVWKAGLTGWCRLQDRPEFAQAF